MQETRISFQYLLYVSDSIAHLFFNVVRQPDELYFQNIKCRLLLVPVKHKTYQKGKETKRAGKITKLRNLSVKEEGNFCMADTFLHYIRLRVVGERQTSARNALDAHASRGWRRKVHFARSFVPRRK